MPGVTEFHFPGFRGLSVNKLEIFFVVAAMKIMEGTFPRDSLNSGKQGGMEN
jgi:hypothetical protein